MKLENLLISLVIVVTLYSGILFAKYILFDEYLKALVYGFFLVIQVLCVVSIFKEMNNGRSTGRK